MTATGEERRRPWRRPTTALKLLLAAILLYVVFSFVPLSEVVAALASADPRLVVLAFATAFLSVWISAGRLKILTDAQGTSFSLAELARINFITRFYGLSLPGNWAGGVIRWHRLTRVGAGKTDALVAIAYSRLIHLTTLVALGTLFWGLQAAEDRDAAIGLAFGGILVALLASIYLLFHARPRWLRSWTTQPGFGFLGRWFEATGNFRDLSVRGWAAVAMASVAENLVGTVTLFVLARAISIETPFVSLGWMRAAVAIATSAPITVSGLGIREGGLMLMLAPYGVPATRAVALGFLVLSCGVFVGAVGGALEARGLVTVGRSGRWRARSADGTPR